MQWESTPLRVKFLKRYKRFFADFEFIGERAAEGVQVAHVPNTGSMKSCLEPGCEALVIPASNPERKLRWTLVALKAATGSWVGVDTSIPNKLVKEVANSGANPLWKNLGTYRSEVKINAETRLDGVFESSNKKIFIEIKNTTLRVEVPGEKGQVVGQAQFPDAVTERGQKHLRELMQLMSEGNECELIFTIQRSDCESFAPAKDIDPEYARLLGEAAKKGLIISPWRVEVSEAGVAFNGKLLPVEL